MAKSKRSRHDGPLAKIDPKEDLEFAPRGFRRILEYQERKREKRINSGKRCSDRDDEFPEL